MDTDWVRKQMKYLLEDEHQDERAEQFNVWLDTVRAEAWDEGHMVGRAYERELDTEEAYHYSVNGNPYVWPSRWDAVEASSPR